MLEGFFLDNFPLMRVFILRVLYFLVVFESSRVHFFFFGEIRWRDIRFEGAYYSEYEIKYLND